MHLKSLELTGFKSFAEAKISFPQGVTAIVGPNGTGKSNVVDSILWVLGEQSAKTLRSERMEDVIFNGTEARKPLGMAEVSLVMGGVEEERLRGLPGLPEQLAHYHEVMITRRLYRNGDSDYLINKTSCRLKDVRGLFLDSRAGTKGHTIIEQGRIEQILNATPQDRRELIEETAGIVRYKKQKAEALRKLDSTQQNLLRVKDIIAEVRRQLNSLERQARQARSYQTLYDEAKTLEIRLLSQECRGLVSTRTIIETELAQLDLRDAELMAEQGRLEEHLEGTKLRLVSGTESLNQTRERLAAVEHQQAQALTAIEVEKGRVALVEQQRQAAEQEVGRLASQEEQIAALIQTVRERLTADEAEGEQANLVCAELGETAKGLTARRAAGASEEAAARQSVMSVTVEATRMENRLSTLAAQDEQAVRRIERLGQELAEIEGQHAALMDRLEQTLSGRQAGEASIAELRGQYDAAAEETRRNEDEAAETEQRLRRAQEDIARVDSRVKVLQGVLREEMGYGREGEEEATSLRNACSVVHESVGEWLIVPPGLERAVEAVLGERLRAWLVEEPAHGRRAIEFLNERGMGRGTFIPSAPRHTGSSSGEAAWWEALHDQPGIVGRATDLLRTESTAPEVLASLFEGVVIVNSLEVAIAQWARGLWSAPSGPTLVTIDGDVLAPSGVLTGGTAGSNGGVLLRRREVQRLEEERHDLLTLLEQLRSTLAAHSDAARRGRQTMEQLTRGIRDAEMRVLGLAKDESSLQKNLDDLARRLSTVRTERHAQEEDHGRLRQDKQSTSQEVAALREEQGRREAALADLQARLRADEEESQVVHQRLTEARAALASIEARIEHGQQDLARLSHEHEAHADRRAALATQLDALASSLEQSRAERDRNEALFRELDQQTIGIRQTLIEAQERYDADFQAVQELERLLSGVRVAVSSSRESRTALEVRRAEINTQLAGHEQTLSGTYQLSVEAVVALAEEPATVAAAESMEESREQLRKIRERLERLGPINLAAIEEHRELEERYRFLTAQEEDLSKSIASLKEIINRINRTTKELFLETFNELQQKFGEVFGRFFPGGRAELVLTEPPVDGEGAPVSDEPGVDIAAQPPGKRLKSLAMLSGGEKTLTAMALIFASFLIRPTPFCILDEIDAPLDEENIGRFTTVLRELSQNAQFLVITHNKRTMSIADSLFGVTMEEPGVSKLVSVRLADLQPA